jgi:hypothetical protein
MMPQMGVGPNMARTMVEDGHIVKGLASRGWLGGGFSVSNFRQLAVGRFFALGYSKSYEQQPASACLGGHGTEPYEQNTQQSPGRGFKRSPHPLQS